MPAEETVILSPALNHDISAKGKLKQRRSRKACSHCHTRKIRCNVLENGVPCSNCIDANTHCQIRKRKNQRRESTPPDEGHRGVLDHSHNWRVSHPSGPPAPATWNNHAMQQQAPQHRHSIAPNVVAADNKSFISNGVENQSQSSTSPPNSDGRVWTDMGSGLTWDQNAMVDASSASCDFSHLTDLDDIFTFTGNAFLPGLPQATSGFGWSPAYAAVPTLPGSNFVANGNGNGNAMPHRPTSLQSVHIPGLNPRDQEYLRGEGCFDLPPGSILRQMMSMYFRMMHPNLPIVAEDQFWALWNGDEFMVGESSFLLLRAMIFAATSYSELETLASLGFVSKREARNTYYRQAKLLFDFSIERDPIANAQACLLLSYNAPNYNILRLNSYWVTNAIRFAEVARAKSYWRVHDPVKQRILKRLWWGVIFRDRILSLGLRRSIQVELDRDWAAGEQHILTAEDFQNELGHSPVHDPETQLRVVEVVAATCRLMQCLSTVSSILYKYEHLDDRLDHVSKCISPTVKDIQRCLDSLRSWHEQAIRLFPFPISLDDAHETICVYANMMFSYHAAAVFGLHTYLILLREIFPVAKSLFSLEESREALEVAHHDVARRIQELVQVRLVKYLPISASAVLALPLILQAINVAAARGSNMEAVEGRRLDVFTRTLKSQQQSFDGSDFCADVLANVVAYAQDDSKFVNSMTAWRDSKDANGNGTTNGQAGNKIKLDWGNLIYKRPRLFLRIVLYLDQAFSAGRPSQEDDFPPELQRGAA